MSEQGPFIDDLVPVSPPARAAHADASLGQQASSPSEMKSMAPQPSDNESVQGIPATPAQTPLGTPVDAAELGAAAAYVPDASLPDSSQLATVEEITRPYSVRAYEDGLTPSEAEKLQSRYLLVSDAAYRLCEDWVQFHDNRAHMDARVSELREALASHRG